MKNRSEGTWLFVVIAAALLALLSACTRNKQEAPATGPHDTPIIVQGGSLWIWSSVNFIVPSSAGNVSDFEYVLPSPNGYVDTITAYSDQFLRNKIGSMSLARDVPWALCGVPHDIKIWSPNTSTARDTISFASAVPKNPLPIFWPMQFGSGNGPYGFGRRHVNPNPFTALNLKTGDANFGCPAPTPQPPSCFTSPGPQCSIACGTPQCFIQLNY